jgi:hypothetical protein
VFSLGAVLYEMLTAQNPFTFDAPKENEALDRVRGGRFPAVRALLASVPQGLEAIVMRAMAPERGDRYQTCDKMREDLEAFARRESYTLSPADFGQFVRDLLDAPGPEPERAKSATPPKRLSGSRAVAAPRAFNDALGGALASLGGDDDGPDDVALAATSAAPIIAPRRPTVVAKPVQVHAAIVVPEPKRSPTDMTDLIPRAPKRAPLIISALALVALAATATWHFTRRAAPAPLSVPLPAPVPVPVPVPVPAAPLPAASIITTVLPAPPSHDKHHARTHAVAAIASPPPTPVAAASPAPTPPPGPPAKAHLTLTADVTADAYIDGQYIRATPIVDYELPPGRHTIHLESAAPGLRLIPRDRTVDLKPGELQQVRMELK